MQVLYHSTLSIALGSSTTSARITQSSLPISHSSRVSSSVPQFCFRTRSTPSIPSINLSHTIIHAERYLTSSVSTTTNSTFPLCFTLPIMPFQSLFLVCLRHPWFPAPPFPCARCIFFFFFRTSLASLRVYVLSLSSVLLQDLYSSEVS